MKTVIVLEGSFAKRQEILNKLKESLGKCEIIRVDSEDNYNQVVLSLMELSFSESNKLFIVDEFPSLSSDKNSSSDRTKMLKYFSSIFGRIPEGNVIVFNNLGISSDKFLDEVKKFGKIFSFPETYTILEAKKEISSYFGKKNKSIQQEDVDSIANSLASFGKVSVDKLNVNLNKLESYIGGKNKITKEDVLTVFSDNKDFIIWNFYDVLDRKDFCYAFYILQNHLSNCKDYLGEIFNLLHSLRWRYKLLLLIKNCKDSLKMSKNDIVNEILKLKKLEQKGKDYLMYMELQEQKGEGVSQYSDKMIYRILSSEDLSNSKYTLKDLDIILYAINKAIDKIRCQSKKINVGENEIKIAIEFVILTICGKITKKSVLNVMNNNINDLIYRKYI